VSGRAGDAAARMGRGAAHIESGDRRTVVGVPENGTGQLHYVCAQTDGQLHHYWLDASGWTYLTSFGAGADSAPCLIEGTYGAHDEIGVGDF